MPKTYRYKVLCGTHIVGEMPYGPTSPAGSVFQTQQDLSAHNVPGQQPRFELLHEAMEAVSPEQRIKDLQAKGDAILAELAMLTGISETKETTQPPVSESKTQDDGLDSMTTGQLKAFAADANIDVLGVNRKDELISVIRRAIANS